MRIPNRSLQVASGVKASRPDRPRGQNYGLNLGLVTLWPRP